MNEFIMQTASLRQGKYSWNESYAGSRKVYAREFENYTFLENSTFEEEPTDYVFDRLGVRIPFIVAYSIVFCFCVFGNLMVILLVILNRRLKSTTNFFLANLAFADLCVGIFCVFQNLGFYLITSWVFGDFLCKMNQFIHGLSCTASIFILVVICTERYLAIIHPIRCKQILTRNRLRLMQRIILSCCESDKLAKWSRIMRSRQPDTVLACQGLTICGPRELNNLSAFEKNSVPYVINWVIITLVWTISSAYSMPRYLISHTISNPLSGSSEIICIMSRIRYNSKAFDVINFILLYLIPLGVMSVLYSLIAVRLWHSGLEYPPPHRCKTDSSLEETSTENSTSFSMEKRNLTITDNRRSFYNSKSHILIHGSHCPTNGIPSNSKSCYRSSKNILRARRRVIRMLCIIVLAFAICNLPYHARKMWQYWSKNYDGASTFSSLFTPITFLCTYCSSAINPLLYAFLSKNFQKSMKDFLSCRCKGKTSRHLSTRQKSYSKSVSRASSLSKNR